MSVRSRTVELSTNPEFLEEPLEQFETPGEAKLEADAHLAICIDEVVERLVKSDGHKQRFMAKFSKDITDTFPTAANSSIDPKVAIERFGWVFKAVYKDEKIIDEVVTGTAIGKRATAAGNNYASACEQYLLEHLPEGAPPHLFLNFESYRNPSVLLGNGLATYKNELVRMVTAMQASGLSTEAKQQHLAPSTRPFLRLASLSMGQSRLYRSSRSASTVTGRGFDTVPDIEKGRSFPLHESRLHQVLRPRNMCPALPDLPPNTILHGGSGIAKLWQLSAELIIATNMHALNDDRPQYRIAGYEPYRAYLALGHSDV